MTINVTKKNCAQNTPVIPASPDKKHPAIGSLPDLEIIAPTQSSMESEECRQAIAATGIIVPDPIIADGKPQRFHVPGDKAGSKNGYYIALDNAAPVIFFGCWKRGIHEKWCPKSWQDMSAAERAEQKQNIETAKKERAEEEQVVKKAAREEAAAIWKNAPLAPDSYPYLTNKGVKNYGLRLYEGRLVIPVYDDTGMLHGLQYIDNVGNKWFLTGTRVKECFYLIGEPSGTLCIAEGYATAASVHEATGHTVAVAFNAGNLQSVALALRVKFPEIKIVICADNDAQTPGNPGLTQAKAAAAAVGGYLAHPKE